MLQTMSQGKVIVVGQSTPFALYLKKMEINVCEVGERFPDIRGAMSHDCEAIYWTMRSVCRIHLWHIVRNLLLGVPENGNRILDFNLKVFFADKISFVKESLHFCDLLKIDEHEFLSVCKHLGLTSDHMLDNGFEMMRQFNIKTIILTHGTRGCHVLHGNSVSEKWGFSGLGDSQSEEAEAAFLASFYVASRTAGRLFTECHRMAFDYMKEQYETIKNR